jgi:hypothetical protein
MEFKFIDGKYLLRDGPPQSAPTPLETIAPPPPRRSQAPVESRSEEDRQQYWASTQGLLNEIKKAYSLILQEKEEQILQLKEEVADLKTLVRVLEEDNNRIKNLQPKLDFDLGLEL